MNFFERFRQRWSRTELDVTHLITEGLRHLGSGNTAAALPLLLKADDVTPGNPEILVAIGDCLRYGPHDFLQAIARYDAAIEAQPDYPLAYARRAGAHYDLDRFDLAKADLERAMELGHDKRFCQSFLAHVYEKTNQLAKSLELLDIMLIENPEDLYALNNRGVAKRRYGKPGANADFEECVRLTTLLINAQENLQEAYHWRPFAYANLGQFEAANEDLAVYASIAPDDARMVHLRLQRAFGARIRPIDDRRP